MLRRSEQTMMDLILRTAEQDHRIRAVLMNGSRASPHAKKDIFQDYDIVYIVNDVETFVDNRDWISQFGETLIVQEPDEMDGLWEKDHGAYTYLMQFKDGNRIDLKLITPSKLSTMPRDSQSILLLDKDGLFEKFPAPSDADYLPIPPTEKQFQNACNEFLWVSTYVAKGIWRKELTYAKAMSEEIVKVQLIKLLTWYAGINTHFEKNIGKCGRHLESYLERPLWEKFIKTYVDADYDHMWAALFLMCEIFHEVAMKIAKHFGFVLNEFEYHSVFAYLNEVRKSTVR